MEYAVSVQQKARVDSERKKLSVEYGYKMDEAESRGKNERRKEKETPRRWEEVHSGLKRA